MSRVLVVYDVDGWAQHRFASGVAKYAPEGMEVVTCDTPGYLNRMEPEDRARFDGVCTPLFASFKKPGCKRLVALLASHALMHDAYDPKNFLTLGVTKDRHRRLARKILTRADAAIARNNALASSLRPYNTRIQVIPAGVDVEIFHPRGRTPTPHGKLRVGWCGNKHCKLNRNFKGYEHILRPLMSRPFASDFEWQINTRDFRNALSPPEMAQWYRSLDVFLTTASAEGTPNPPMEAAACGCCVLATNVGQLSDWGELHSRKLLLPTYENDEEARGVVRLFEQELSLLNRDRERLRECGEALAASIQTRYSYEHIAPRVIAHVAGIDRPKLIKYTSRDRHAR